MRVVCIDNETFVDNPAAPTIIKGNIYTVINEFNEDEEHEETNDFNITYPGGIYYELIELGPEFIAHSSLFLPVNEDQQDEAEFERDYSLKEMQS